MSGFGQVTRGQLVVSVNAIAEELKIDRSKVRRCIDRWVRIGWITRDRLPVQRPTKVSANLPSLITVVNYDNYDVSRESADQLSGQSATNERTGGEPERKRKDRRANRKEIFEQRDAGFSVLKTAAKGSRDQSEREQISDAQFLYFANSIARWRDETGHIFVGGDGESYARAFHRRFGITPARWQEIQRQFADVSGF